MQTRCLENLALDRKTGTITESKVRYTICGKKFLPLKNIILTMAF